MAKAGSNGFTAMELMITMAVVAILLSTAVPSFKDYGWNLRLKTAMDQLQTDLNLARSTAISHTVHTIICPADATYNCTGKPDWQSGWIVFSDLNGDLQKQQTEPLLTQSGASTSLKIRSSRSRTYLRFLPNGTSPGSNISIVFCDKRGAKKAGKITVSNTGRIRMQTGGIDPTSNCP